MWHVLETGEERIGVWWGGLMERDYLKDISVDGKIILKWILKTWAWTGLLCLRIRRGGGRL
jgi:hypothetical protein